MKLRRGKGDYKVPPIGSAQGAAFVERGELGPMHYRLMMTAPEQIAKFRADPKTKDVLGRPVYFAHHRDTLMLWPAPDAKGELEFAFYPPIQII